MTDTFASESNDPGGISSETAQQGGDVTGALADLERKLRELERELSSLGRRRGQDDAASLAGAAPPSTQAPPPSPPPASTVTSTPAGTPAAPATTPAQPQFSPPSGRLVDEAIEPQDTAASERTRPSAAQLASLAELRRFRDRLERFAKELATEYDALLSRVMAGLSSAPAPAQSTRAHGEPAPAPIGASPTSAPASIPTSPPAAPTSIPMPPPSTPPPAPTPAAPEVTAAQSRENALFEGRVELGVGPFYDIASLGAFERQLASLPGVSEAAVRRFEASHAVVDVRIATPVALVRELRRAAGSDFSVREIASGRILLTFDES